MITNQMIRTGKTMAAGVSLFAIILFFSLCASAPGKCPAADLTGDCRVDLADIALFAEQWLNGDCGESDSG